MLIRAFSNQIDNDKRKFLHFEVGVRQKLNQIRNHSCFDDQFKVLVAWTSGNSQNIVDSLQNKLEKCSHFKLVIIL